MGLSAKAISYPNLEAASEIRPETETGSHLIKIFGYSLTKEIGSLKCFNSNVFTIGGYNWVFEYFPNGLCNADKDCIAFFLRLKSTEARDVKTQITVTILKQNGLPSDMSIAPEVFTFNSTGGILAATWGKWRFAEKTKLEASDCLKDDAFTMKCTLTVVKGTNSDGAQAINSRNLETASAIRAETVTGSHLFKISGYCLAKGSGIGKSYDSGVFTIGGYNWIVKYYPDGFSEKDKDFVSFSLRLKSEAPNVHVRVTLTILEPNGLPSDMSCGPQLFTFKSTCSVYCATWEKMQFVERTKLEASECLKDDAFTVKCSIKIVKGNLEVIIPDEKGITVPPSNLNRHFVDLLESEKGADVTFEVNGERFNAHRCVLAARSAVFNAMLFGRMKRKRTDVITVDDIEAPVFKSMLYFIYSDSLPNCAETTTDDDDDGEKLDLRLMAQHLLVAADRYDLERLRLLCEDILCKNLDVNTVVSTLILAERHNFSQLKAKCLKFVSSPEVFKAVALSDGFHHLMKSYPSILNDLQGL